MTASLVPPTPATPHLATLHAAALHLDPLFRPALDLASTSAHQDTAPLPAAPPGTGDPADGPAPRGGGGLGGMFFPFLLMGVVFWFLIIGPERKNRKKRELMLGALKKGDKVMTTGGLYGRVSELRDDIVLLDTGDVVLKFSRAAIQGLADGEAPKETAKS